MSSQEPVLKQIQLIKAMWGRRKPPRKSPRRKQNGSFSKKSLSFWNPFTSALFFKKENQTWDVLRKLFLGVFGWLSWENRSTYVHLFGCSCAGLGDFVRPNKCQPHLSMKGMTAWTRGMISEVYRARRNFSLRSNSINFDLKETFYITHFVSRKRNHHVHDCMAASWGITLFRMWKRLCIVLNYICY